jgi:ribonuclease HI
MDKANHQQNPDTQRKIQKQTLCLQINLQHSRAATYNMMKMMEKEEPDLILTQEIYEYQNKPTGIDKRSRIYTAGNGKHRAAIIIPNNKIEAMLITQISNEDTVLLEIIHNKRKFFAASMYFDIEEQIENNLAKVDEILQFAKGEKILIAMDSNSRSKTWHDRITNARGKKLEDYLSSRQLHIANSESEMFTFNNRCGSSNIDLTITNNNTIAEIKDWQICTDESCSDHNFIKFKIGTTDNNYNYNYNYNHHGIRYIVKEERYLEYDQNLAQEIPKFFFKTLNYKGNEEETDMNLSAAVTAQENNLERTVEALTDAMQSASRKTFKIINTQKKIKKKSVPWWTDSLTTMRKRLNAIRRLYQRTRNDEDLRKKRKHKYHEEKKNYQHEIRKEKLNSWKEYCNVTASINPWSQVYKLAAGKARNNSIMTSLRKPDGTLTTSILETMNIMLDHLITEDEEEEEKQLHKNIRKMTEEPINTEDDTEFSQEEIKQTIESFNNKKAPGIDGITSGIFLRTFNTFPRLVTAIYNQCLQRGQFPKKWKTAQIIPITKPGKENSTEPSKYRPISLINIGGKILEKLLINRINHHLYKNDLLLDNQYGFTPQKSTIDAAMEVKKYIEPELEQRKVVIMTSLDVEGAFNSAWWYSVLKGLKEAECPRNLYQLSKGYFSQRTAVMITNSISIERKVTKGCPQGSCCGPGFWNLIYNSLFQLEFTKQTKIIAFADDLIILTKGESIVEAENYMNLELRKITDWAQNNKLKFNENKSQVMLMNRRKRKERKEVEIYLNNKILEQVNKIKYLGIIFDSKMTFKDHVNYIEEKCNKLIFTLSKSAKVTWGLKHEAMKTIYTGGILPLILYGAPVWKRVLDIKCYKSKLIRTQRLINIRIAKAYRTVSNEALCVITGLKPINIKIEETAKYYECLKRQRNLLDLEMEVKNWTHPTNTVEIIDDQPEDKYKIKIYTDGSKTEQGVGSGIVIFTGNVITDMKIYKLNERCSNNQAEQLAILKALENIKPLEITDKSAIIYTDSLITLQSLKNKQNHTYLIEKIRKEVTEMEQKKWKITFSWIKAHAGHQGNELADELAKEAANKKDIQESYKRIPKSLVRKELCEQSVIKWQSEWDNTTKGAITKTYFPLITDRLKLKINATQNLTTMLTGHGNIKAYLYRFKIIDNPMCSCQRGEQTVDHILFECELTEKERTKLKAAVMKSEKWPVNKVELMNKYSKSFKTFTDNIILDND